MRLTRESLCSSSALVRCSVSTIWVPRGAPYDVRHGTRVRRGARVRKRAQNAEKVQSSAARLLLVGARDLRRRHDGLPGLLGELALADLYRRNKEREGAQNA
jgi:hypothetical protein